MSVPFDFPKGYILAGKYEIVSRLGSGLEGEVYLTKECETGIERAAKFYFPNKNIRPDHLKRHARKLFKIRNCKEIIQYHAHESLWYRKQKITCLIWDYVEGELLATYLSRQPSKKLHYYKALHLLYAIVSALEAIHALGEYHGDLHDGNVFVKPQGMGFDVKLIDAIDWRDSPPANIRKDVCDAIRLLYDTIGGQKAYSKMPTQVKAICCGLRPSLIEKKFKNAQMLKTHMENIVWTH